MSTFKNRIAACLFLLAFSTATLISCGSQSTTEDSADEQTTEEAAEHPEGEHPSDSDSADHEHPAGEHPSDSTENQ